MSVEAFTHQLYEPFIIPDDLEIALRDVLHKNLHLNGEDIEHALHNPWDLMQRLSTELVHLYRRTNSPYIQVLKPSDDTSMTLFTLGSSLSDALHIEVTERHLPSGASYPISNSISVDMESIFTAKQGMTAIVDISDATSRVNVIGNEYKRGHNHFTEKELYCNDPAINLVYLSVYNKLLAALNNNEQSVLHPADYISRQIGRHAITPQQRVA